MAYVHDVFISYKRDPVRNQWLEEHFIPLFSSTVREAIAAAALRRPAGIFYDQTQISKASLVFDQTGIEPGQPWRQALAAAIRTSRCMVAIWTPLYFWSPWCLAEWDSFRNRPRAVVVPIRTHGGESFPRRRRPCKPSISPTT